MSKEMSKSELLQVIEELKIENAKLKKRGKRGSGRKLELLETMVEMGRGKILDVATKMGVSSKNVSSLKCYLKKEGWGIINDEDGMMKITKYKGDVIDNAFIEEYVKNERALMEKVEEVEE